MSHLPCLVFDALSANPRFRLCPHRAVSSARFQLRLLELGFSRTRARDISTDAGKECQLSFWKAPAERQRERGGREREEGERERQFSSDLSLSSVVAQASLSLSLSLSLSFFLSFAFLALLAALDKRHVRERERHDATYRELGDGIQQQLRRKNRDGKPRRGGKLERLGLLLLFFKVGEDERASDFRLWAFFFSLEKRQKQIK